MLCVNNDLQLVVMAVLIFVIGWDVQGNVEAGEMAVTFNCGIGMALIVADADKDAVLQQLQAAGEHAVVIGNVLPAENGERILFGFELL
jgi:phosphoribosylformylglycinamidine cyclo-ligase